MYSFKQKLLELAALRWFCSHRGTLWSLQACCFDVWCRKRGISSLWWSEPLHSPRWWGRRKNLIWKTEKKWKPERTVCFGGEENVLTRSLGSHHCPVLPRSSHRAAVSAGLFRPLEYKPIGMETPSLEGPRGRVTVGRAAAGTVWQGRFWGKATNKSFVTGVWDSHSSIPQA